MTDVAFLEYIENFMKGINLPPEAISEFMALERQIFTDSKLKELFKKLKADFFAGDIEVGDALNKMEEIAEETGISKFSLHFIFLINCTDIILEKYKAEGLSEELFWHTMEDLRYKLLECYEVKGVWGTFVGTWFAGFFDLSRLALGRFQYELSDFGREKYDKAGVVLTKDSPVYNFHIPSSGQPFDPQARLESYRLAYDFYGCKEKGEPIILVCNSWLLYEGHREFLPEKSNILSFMNDFDIIESWEKDEFGDAWRVFGGKHELPMEQWPEDTSMRRAFKKRLLEKGKTGGGYGVIVFDGEKIIN